MCQSRCPFSKGRISSSSAGHPFTATGRDLQDVDMGARVGNRRRCKERDPIRLYADLSGGLELIGPEDESVMKNEDDLKEWIWNNHKDKLLSAMTVRYEKQKSELHRAKLSLLDKITQIQRLYLQKEPMNVVFGQLLEGILELMESEYGFVCEVDHDEDGTMCLVARAFTNIAWNDWSRAAYQEFTKGRLKFYKMDSLYGLPVTTGKAIISNDTKVDSRATGLPEGHRPINTYLGIPFFKEEGVISGVIGIANKAGGYTEADVEFLEMFSWTCSNLIQGYEQIRRNQQLINTLEEKVRERTKELQLANENLEDANRKVLKSSAAQLQHFACMSHELRTPLNCIIGLSSVLLETDLNPMQHESVRMMVTSGDLLMSVVNDVLDFSRLETGNVEIEITRSNLQEALNSVVHSIGLKAKSRHLKIRTFFDSSIPEYVSTDSLRLQQILYNLLGNAVKFSKDGGDVELSLLLREGPLAAGEACDEKSELIQVNAHNQSLVAKPSSQHCGLTARALPGRSEHYLRIVVKDYGKGIEQKDFQRIFEPFRQADSETERAYGGTGLGLSVTRRLVHRMGGIISVNSAEGEWSCFTVDLPFYDSPVNRGLLTERLGCSVCLIADNVLAASHVANVFRDYNIPFSKVRSMQEIAKCGIPPGPWICLVQEDLYNEEWFKLLSSKGAPILLTFGPKYSVKETAGHFRSVVQLLPSVLVQSIAVYYERSKSLVKARTSFRQHPSPNIVPNEELRILIAEDNVINQKVLLKMLKRLGLEKVEVVDNGRKAVVKEAAEPFNVVLMDMQMPVMDGLTACKHILKRRDGHPRAKVIFVTAQVSHSFEAECLKAGASGFLPKPFHISDIKSCFERLATKKRREDASVEEEMEEIF